MTAVEPEQAAPALPTDLVHWACCIHHGATLCGTPGGDEVNDRPPDCVVCDDLLVNTVQGVPCPVSKLVCPALCHHNLPYKGG